MFKVGDIIKIKPEWCNNETEKTMTFTIANVNPITERCYIRPLKSNLVLVPEELVGFNMIEYI